MVPNSKYSFPQKIPSCTAVHHGLHDASGAPPVAKIKLVRNGTIGEQFNPGTAGLAEDCRADFVDWIVIILLPFRHNGTSGIKKYQRDPAL
jgi:hypothetical protein